MNKLLKIASILDKSGHYELSDKLYKIAKTYNPNISASDLANEVRGIITIDPGKPGSYQKAMEKLRQNPNLKVVTEWNKDPLVDMRRQYLSNPGTTKNTSKSGLYVPPVEYYQGVDADKYNEFGNFQFKNRNIPQPNRYNFDGNTKVMDGSMYYNNPYTPKDVLELRNKLIPTNFRDEIKRYESKDSVISSNNPQNFATSLWEFARRNNTSSSLVNSFDAFADAGAMYKGQSIKNIPELQELYKIIRNTPRIFSKTEVSEMLEDIEAGRYDSENYDEEDNYEDDSEE